MNSIKDKVILITGGSSGIGKATAIAFAKQGAKVAIASRNEDKGKEALKEIQKFTKNAIWIQVNVMNHDEVKEMVSEVIEKFGHLDFAFNNAYSAYDCGLLDTLHKNYWDKTILGTLNSVFYCMKWELKEMLKNGKGVIVNNSSVDGLVGSSDSPAYSTAKHGVIGLTKSSAIQYAEKGIRINAICPGWVETPPIKKWIKANPKMREVIDSDNPLRRIGQPNEIAEMVLWLCSDLSSFVVGSVFNVDGGSLA